MDAVKFLEEYNRMCNTYNDCVGCPMKAKPFCYPNDIITNDERKELVDAVEKWSEEHPVKTNLDRFKEVFPDSIEKMSTTPSGVFVTREWWDAEYKGEETIPKWKCDNCVDRPPNKEKE